MQSRGKMVTGWISVAVALMAVMAACAAGPSAAAAAATSDVELDVAADVAPEFDAQQAALLALYESTAADAAANNQMNARAIDAAVDEFTAMMEITDSQSQSQSSATQHKVLSKKRAKHAAAAAHPPKKGGAPPKAPAGQCAAPHLATITKLQAQIVAAEAEAKKLGCVRGKDHPTKREQCRQIWCKIDALKKMLERAKKAVEMCGQIEKLRDTKVRDAKRRVKCVADEPKRRKDKKEREIREEKERKERERKRKEEEERKRKELARQKAIAAAKRKEAARLAEIARQKRLREEAEARRNKEAARVRRLNAEYASPKSLEVSVHRHKGPAPKPGQEGGKGDVTVIQAKVKAPSPVNKEKKKAEKKQKKAAKKAAKKRQAKALKKAEKKKLKQAKKEAKKARREEKEKEQQEEEDAAPVRLMGRKRNLAAAATAAPCVPMCREGQNCGAAGAAKAPSFLEQQAQLTLSLSSRSRSYSQQRAAPAKGGKEDGDFCFFVYKMSDKEQAAEMARARKLLASLEAELKKLLAALKAHLSLKPIPLACPKKVHLPFTFASATASGDPHVDTFDGAHHDVMTAGWFTWVENPVLTVQGYSQLGCMPASVPNTCLRAVVVRIRPPGSEEQLLVSWGQWPPERKMQNIVVQDSTGKNINQHPNAYKAANWLNNKYSIAMAGGNLHIKPVGAAIGDPELAVSVTIGAYFLAVTLPNIAPHRGSTNGLMGFFVGHKNRNDVQNIFRLRGATGPNPAMKPNSIHGQTPEIRDWAASHVLSGPGGKNPPIPLASGTGLKQQKYLNAHAQHIKHAGFLEMATESGSELEVAVGAAAVSLALAEAAAEFSPIPRASKPLVLPSVTPPVTPAKLAFCKKLLAAGQKASKSKNKATFAAQLKSCLQDADSPTVARTVATAITVARTQQRAATKALKKKVVKDEARCANTGKCDTATTQSAEIVYNADSPLSADDLRRLRQVHADFYIPREAKLVAQDTLDRASLTLDDAHAAKKALLDQYPTIE